MNNFFCQPWWRNDNRISIETLRNDKDVIDFFNNYCLSFFFTIKNSQQQYESFDQNDQSDIDSNPGNFEVLDSSSISKSGSFGPSEHIAINADTDEIKDAIVPAPIDHQLSILSQQQDQKQQQQQQQQDVEGGNTSVESDQGTVGVENTEDSTDGKSVAPTTSGNPSISM